jgi:hypothetical protein
MLSPSAAAMAGRLYTMQPANISPQSTTHMLPGGFSFTHVHGAPMPMPAAEPARNLDEVSMPVEPTRRGGRGCGRGR